MASQITNLQSEKRAAEYVIYSTALLLCLEILGILLAAAAATCPEHQALRSLQFYLSSAQNALYTVYSCYVSMLRMEVLSSLTSAESRCSGEIQACSSMADKILQNSG